MKKTEQIKKLEAVLRSSKIASGGFLGTDNRDLSEIIDADLSAIEKLGRTTDEIAEKMQQIAGKAKAALGSPVNIDDRLTAIQLEVKGLIVCPFPHPASFDKAVTTVTDKNSGEQISFSDLNIHLISEHSFFEGKGSLMRIDPAKLIRILFG